MYVAYSGKENTAVLICQIQNFFEFIQLKQKTVKARL